MSEGKVRVPAGVTVAVALVDEGVKVTAKYAGGGGEEFVIASEHLANFAAFGVAERFGAIGKKEKDPEVAASQVAQLREMVAAGQFSTGKRQAAGKPASDLAQAVAKVNGVSVERAEEWLAGKERGFKLSLRKDRRIAQALLELAGGMPEESGSVFEGI